MPWWAEVLLWAVGVGVFAGACLYGFAFAAEKLATARVEFETAKLRQAEAEQDYRAAVSDADSSEALREVAKQQLADALRHET
jgi:hypothetical protein